MSALSKKIFDEVTKGAKVTEQEILAYYTQNQSQYGTPESRDVRHILVAEKSDGDKVDFAASKAKADDIYAQLENGADFAALAKSSSADPGSKDSGGKLTISRGQTVPEFDKISFELDTGELSKPVKTQYGYHVIEAVSDVRKASTTPIDKVRRNDSRHPPPAEAQRGDAGVGRGPEGGLRGQGELRGRLRAAGAPRGAHRDHRVASRA